MKEDELHGPQELKNDKFNVDENNPEKQKCVTKMFRETMRQYQMNRLKYHFALIDCDSVETASAIYEGCDGFEFESSGSFVDLRFVPDEMTFDDEPTDVSEEVDAASFKPKYFTTAALRQSRVELTWDEGDHDRVQALTRKKFSQDEILDMDVKAYLASSSSEEDDLAEDLMVKDNVVHEEGTQSSVETKMCEADVINKYRELLKSIQEEDEKKEQNDMEMEITWVPGLKENAKEMVKKNMEAKKKVIPQLKYLEKQKQERKQRVKEKKKMAKGTQVEVGSDDDLPLGVDLNDEFHAEEQQKTGMKSLKEKSTKKDECDSGVTLEEQAENDKQNALLSLLMMDEEVDDRTHFDYDSIVNQQNLTKRKRKMLLKKNNKLMEDDFQTTKWCCETASSPGITFVSWRCPLTRLRTIRLMCRIHDFLHSIPHICSTWTQQIPAFGAQRPPRRLHKKKLRGAALNNNQSSQSRAAVQMPPSKEQPLK
uniref:ESF1 homolog isoform X2 n=1 Tax=Myxine glutinosa TaxID=7769 RepID=UPI00358F6EEB